MTTRTAPTRSPDPDRKFMKRAMEAPLLERDHELALATAWKEEGDEKALHELTTAEEREDYPFFDHLQDLINDLEMEEGE